MLRFDKNSAEYLKDQLSHCYQKKKVKKTLSNWTYILHGVPQGFMLDPFLFNLLFCDLFLFIPNTDLVSYADDNKPFLFGFRIIV